MEIRVVTKSDCPFCEMTKKWFDDNGFDYHAELMDNEDVGLQSLPFHVNGCNSWHRDPGILGTQNQ